MKMYHYSGDYLMKYWQKLKGNLVTNSFHVAGLLMRQEPTSMGLVWYMVSKLCRKVILADSITYNVSITCLKIPSDLGELRSEVDTLGREWCRVSTLTEYNEIKSRLDCIGGVLSCISNWVNW